MQEQVEKLIEKLIAISKLPLARELDQVVGEDIQGIASDPPYAILRSETYCCGSTDYYNVTVKWEDIDNPLEWFEESFEMQYTALQEKRRLERQASEEKRLAQIKARELEVLAELKEKYEPRTRY